MTEFAASKYLRTWHGDRAKFVRLDLSERIGAPGTTATAVDISASTAKVYLRAWKGPASERTLSDLLMNEEMTKVTDGTGGNPAVVAKRVKIITGAGRVGPVEFSVILVDETVSSEPTPSTFQEEVWGWWAGKLVAAVQP